MVPVNIYTYFLDLADANEKSKLNQTYEPEWIEQHDYIEEYKLRDLGPDSMKHFAERMYQDPELASQFAWNAVRRATDKP